MATATEVRERPILFSAQMILAILDGRKTQTRRIIKLRHPQPTPEHNLSPCPYSAGWSWESDADGCKCKLAARCPYGWPRERLWVRESFVLEANEDDPDNPIPHYRATDPEPHLVTEEQDDFDDRTRWKPSIHMPRWASRITLEIENIRVERLQQITEADAEAEGLSAGRDFDNGVVVGSPTVHEHVEYPEISAIARFKRLWESINGKGSWDASPWVWVIDFRRVEN